jgi:hypothetical protein
VVDATHERETAPAAVANTALLRGRGPAPVFHQALEPLPLVSSYAGA